MEAALKISKVADVVSENSERSGDTLDVSDGSASQVLLKTLSHELRTPLNSIIGFADMMEQEMLGPMGTPQYQSYAHDICNSGRTMLRIMNDLLDQQRFTRIRESEQDFRHMIELAPDFISICRKDIIRVINPAGANMLGMWPVET